MFWKGPVFTRNGFRNQTIDLENCEVSDGFDGAADGVVIPLLRNCHTHLGDTLARSEIPDNLSLEQLVGPSGWKHKWLEKNNVENSIIAGMKEVISSGTGLIMDFREGGKEGVEEFEKHEYLGTSILFGRPKENESLPAVKIERWYSPMDRSLRRELKNSFSSSYWFDTTSYRDLIDAVVN